MMELLYILRDMSASEIGDYLGCSGQTVWRWLKKHGIETRGVNEAKYTRLSSKDWLVETYVEKNMTSGEIAEWIGCPSSLVWEWCQKHGIDCEENGSWPRGEDHHLYKDGDNNYGKGWDVEKKERVRERDGRECQHCGRDEQEHIKLFGTKHVVHHIDPARSVADPEERNAMKNLVTLCRGDCHQSWEKMAPLRPDTTTFTTT
ncbi:helix-turn-helix domain-containing protein [Haloarcula quadrata]|nr:helix-turn-helix domain-containing protein [Haloarcula quadrata]